MAMNRDMNRSDREPMNRDRDESSQDRMDTGRTGTVGTGRIETPSGMDRGSSSEGLDRSRDLDRGRTDRDVSDISE